MDATETRRARPRRRFAYTVGEAARLVGVSPATIRVWEREGLVKTERSDSGYRYFSEEQIARLRRAVWLRRVEKLNTAGIRRVLAEETDGHKERRPRELALGPRLRRLRQEKHLTLEAAARAVGLSPSFLSALERDQASASMATLHRLLDAYQVTFASLLQWQRGGRAAQLKRAARRRSVRSQGVTIEQLADPPARMEPQIFTVEPGAGSDGSYSHEGEGFIYMLEGTFELVIGEAERYRLHPGDSLYFPSTASHRWRNPGSTVARLLWTNTPPTF